MRTVASQCAFQYLTHGPPSLALWKVKTDQSFCRTNADLSFLLVCRWCQDYVLLILEEQTTLLCTQLCKCLWLNLMSMSITEEEENVLNIVTFYCFPSGYQIYERVCIVWCVKKLQKSNGIYAFHHYRWQKNGKVCTFLCKDKYRIKNTMTCREEGEQGAWEKLQWWGGSSQLFSKYVKGYCKKKENKVSSMSKRNRIWGNRHKL